MKARHIVFCLDQAYGNIIPTVGIALRLVERGHRVSYTVTAPFAQAIQRIHAKPLVIDPLETRSRIISTISKVDDCFQYSKSVTELGAFCDDLARARTAHLLAQLEPLFSVDPPDLIVHDDSLDTAGRDYASKYGVPRIRHHSQFIDLDMEDQSLDSFAADELILMTVPEFFQRDRQRLGDRFCFVGMIPDGRSALFDHWQLPPDLHRPLLVSATTGMLPQRDFYARIIEATRDQSLQVILSVSTSHDRISAIDPGEWSNLPNNIRVNSCGSNFDIVRHCALYIGQGGQGGSLEALFWGIPQIIIPPDPYRYSVANRVSELKLGYFIPPAEASAEILRARISDILTDRDILHRVEAAGLRMRNHDGGERAVELIEAYLQGRGRH